MNQIDLGLIALLLVALVSGRVPTAVAFMGFILAVMLLNRIPSPEALAMLAEPASIGVLCLVVFSSVLGRLSWLRNALFSRRPSSAGAIRARFLGMATIISAAMPNTAVVGALMGPAARNARVPARQLLLPLSYAALAGGMVTQFGTSANLMVVGQAARQGVSLGFLDFVLPGLATAAAVYVVLLFVAPPLMRAQDTETASSTPKLFHVEARVPLGSPLVGKTLAENHLRHLSHFYVAEIIRGERLITPARPEEILQDGDTLIFVGDVSHVDELMLIPGLQVIDEVRTRSGMQVHLAVVNQTSALIGSTLRDFKFRANFNASVFAIRRGHERLSGKLGEVELKAGDLLAIAGGGDFLAHAEVGSHFHLILRDDTPVTTLSRSESLIATVLFALFVGSAILDLINFGLLTVLLVAVAMAFSLIRARDLRMLFPFELMVALWGSLMLASLVTRTGLDGVAARAIAEGVGISGHLGALLAIFVLAWALTELLSNVAAALTAVPIALQFATISGLPPEAAALAAAFGASASFLVPFGYQTHLMVMSPGNYRIRDFLKLGTVVLLAYGTAAVGALWLLAGPVGYWD
jgi:di/tricarboxylate transporter